MLSYELRSALEDYQNRHEHAAPLINLLKHLTLKYDEVMMQMKGVAIGSDRLPQASANMHSLLANCLSLFTDFSVKKVILSLGELEDGLKRLQGLEGPTSNAATAALLHTEEASAAFDDFFANPSSLRAWQLLKSAKLAHHYLDVFTETIAMLAGNLEDTRGLQHGDGTLGILLPGENNLNGLVRKLAAIQQMYSELCLLTDVSEVDHPLEVGKVESGSLWVKLFGESRVMGLMASFLEAAARHLYQNYTRDGRVSAIPGKLDSLDKIIDLRSKLREHGITTDGMDEEIAKGAHALARDLTAILERQPSITINGKKTGLGDSELAKRLATEEWPQLPAPETTVNITAV